VIALALDTRRPVNSARTILRRIFSFPVVLASTMVPLAVLTVRSRFNDPDMWWHLRLGQIIWKSHYIPAVDIFSFTAKGHPWVPHEWLAQLTLYAVWQLGGYEGLMLWLSCAVSSLLILGYVLCAKYCGNAKIAFLGSLLMWLFGTAGFAIRPQVSGYLLLVLELLLLQFGRMGNPRWFWLLPPMFALWVNVHGSFFLGLIVAMLTYLLSFFNMRAGSLVAIAWTPERRKYFGLSLGLSVVALFANPIGLTQILYPINAMWGQPIGTAQVQEWQPLALTDPRCIVLCAVIVGVLLLAVVRRAELEVQELTLLLAGGWLAMRHQRMLFVFGILSAPIVCRMLLDFWQGYDREKDRPLLNGVAISAAFLAALFAFPTQTSLVQQVGEGNPQAAVEYIRQHKLVGPMLNEYVFGGYLIWALPEHPVFVDGREDVYDWTGVMPEFARWALLEEPPNRLLDKYHVQFCVLAAHSPVSQAMRLLTGWRTVYADNQAIIFVRDST
jgi:hypothetical protein